MASKSFVFRFDDVEVREREFTLVKAGQVLTVEPKAFRALLFLLHNPQRLISKEELLNSVWGDVAVGDGSLTRCIWLLRRLLEDDINNPRYIATVATIGYRFVCPVEVSEEDSEEAVAAKDPISSDGVGKKVGSRKSLWGWALAGGGALVLCLVGAIWYLHRPLPPPRITAYTQITHDGHQKILDGTDGSRLYFNQMANRITPDSIAQVAVTGGEIAKIPVALPTPNLLDISPDGSSLLVASLAEGIKPANPLWKVRTLGGSAVRLGEAYYASFSPDGNSVAYSAADGCIYAMRNDGTGARKLASDVSKDEIEWIAWSPDGGVIRFTTDDRIWEMSSSGSKPHQVLPGWRTESWKCCGRWTPDGKFFLFLSEGQIWALDERRSPLRQPPPEPVQLTSGPTDWGPLVPSKDGKRIFAQGRTSPTGELSRFDAKTGQFTPLLGGISAQGLVFSGDGKSVAYVSYPEGTLWKADRDGGNPVQLTNPPMDVLLPRWSPDSKQIVFSDMNDQVYGGTIYVVSAEGGSPRKLLPEDHEYQNSPYWSPDGSKIVFNAGPSGADFSGPDYNVRILDLDSRQVTTVPGSASMLGPRWSPDGRYLVSGTEDELHLKIFDFKTQQWSELAQKGLVDSPEWSRDSQYIYFLRVMGGQGVFRIRVKGGEAEKIADLKDWHFTGWFGRWMGLDPTDAPLLLHGIARDDIYALTLEEK